MRFYSSPHRRPYTGRSPYEAVLESVPAHTRAAIEEQLRAGEHPRDVAFEFNLLVGVVELLKQQLRGDTSSKTRALTAMANMQDDDRRRIRTRLDIGDSLEQIAADEDLSIDVVRLIQTRTVAAAARRARSGTTTHETPGALPSMARDGRAVAGESSDSPATTSS